MSLIFSGSFLSGGHKDRVEWSSFSSSLVEINSSPERLGRFRWDYIMYSHTRSLAQFFVITVHHNFDSYGHKTLPNLFFSFSFFAPALTYGLSMLKKRAIKITNFECQNQNLSQNSRQCFVDMHLFFSAKSLSLSVAIRVVLWFAANHRRPYLNQSLRQHLCVLVGRFA